MIEKLEIVKTRNVKTPARGTSVAAGLDFYVPEDLTKDDMISMFDKTGHTLNVDYTEDGYVKNMYLEFGQSACIPSGIKAKLPHGYCMEFHNKSGIAMKRGLIAGACVTGDTEIETNNGLYQAKYLTKEFCDKNNILIKSYNISKKIYEYKECSGFKPVMNTKCIKVTFEDGTEIIGAENHMIYDIEDNRWVALCELI